MHRSAFALATILALSLPSPARAEPPPADVDHYEYRFEDDPVNGLESNPYGEWLKVQKRHPRTLLIRPRASFVMELLQSIGKL